MTEIHDLSQRCRSAFGDALLNVATRSFLVIGPLRDEFEQWASYLGVFAHERVCLDTRLRYSDSLRNLTLQLLQISIRNLHRITELESRERYDLEYTTLQQLVVAEMESGDTEKISSPLIESLKALEAAVNGLHRLGLAMRQSSSTNLMQRITAFMEKIDDGSTEDLFLIRLKAKLINEPRREGRPGASVTLCKQLATSIAFRYFRIQYRNSHQLKLETPRRTQPYSQPINEPVERGTNMSVQTCEMGSRKPLPSRVSQLISDISVTEPTIPESRVALARYESFSPQSTGSASIASVQLKEATYPSTPPVNAKVCPYCAQPLSAAVRKSKRAWEKHVDDDLEPYTCISEDCVEPPQLFSRYDVWVKHMEEKHPSDWTEQVHKTVSWCCDTDHEERYFESEPAFDEHVRARHQDFQDDEEITELKEWCEVRRARRPYTCPICGSVPDDIAKVAPWVMQRSSSTQTRESCQNRSFPEAEIRSCLLRHIASHLKTLSFMSIIYLDDEKEDLDEEHHGNSSYEEVSHDLRRRLSQGFKRKNEEGMFATRMLAKDILSDNELRRIYQSLRSSEQRHPNSISDEDLFVRNIKDKNLYDFLAVLLYARCSQPAVLAFETNLVFGKGSEISLPASKKDLTGLFGERRSDIQEFFNCQTYFCTIIIGLPEDITLQQGGKWRKPWLSETLIGTGSFAAVFAVQIAEHHLAKIRDMKETYDTAQLIARKDFRVHDVGAFRREVQAMKEIRDSASVHPNVLTSLGTLTIEGEKPEFSLFTPMAEGDLSEYFSKDNGNLFPLPVDERCRLISSAMGLADGLHFLHTRITTKGFIWRVFCHMNLKPSNVLIFPGDRHKIWKISDFAILDFNDMSSSDSAEKGILRDIMKPLIRGPEVETAKATNNTNPRGPGTYLPSEAEGHKRFNEKTDVWSLGCIISLLFTYMEFGAPGLESFSDLRAEYSHLPWDTFYGKSFMTRSYTINKAVDKQHKILIDAASKRGSTERDAVRSMMGFLEASVFLEQQDQRCGASEVTKKLSETRQNYYACADSESSGRKLSSNLFDLIRGRKNRDHSTTDSRTIAPPVILRWRLDRPKAAKPKGCQSSPNGDFIASWDEEEIMLFANSHGVKPELPAVHTEGRKPDGPDRVWKAIKLANHYLIAITTGSEYNCYIFDIAVAPNLTTYTVFSLPETETSLLDISPDLKSFMCIRKSNKGRSLFYSSTFEPFVGKHSNEVQKTARGQEKIEAHISLINHKTAWLRWQAADMLRIISHSKNRGYVALQSHDSPLLLSVAFFCVDKHSHITARLDDANCTGETASLFTDMACMSNSSTGTEVLVVLRAKHIFQVGFTDLKTRAKISTLSPINDYRILKVRMDESSGKTFALGVRSMNASVCLFEAKWLNDSTILQITKRLAVLDSLLEEDEPELRICQQSGQKIALVTGLTSNDRDAVYQVNLNEPSSI